MFKYKMMVLIFLTAVIVSGKAYCQEVNNTQQIETASGTVTSADHEGNVVDVQTDKGVVVFYVSVESDLLQGNHHMASIEIEKGDPVIVVYKSTPLGKNIILKLVDNKLDKI